MSKKDITFLVILGVGNIPIYILLGKAAVYRLGRLQGSYRLPVYAGFLVPDLG
ncbi:MAG: hypothetical protein ACYTFK_00785 [Planctomycetota bacterium]